MDNRPRIKRPTLTAQRTALFALLASRDTLSSAKVGADQKPLDKQTISVMSMEIATRALLGAMGLTGTEENLKAARTEVVRAAIVTGIAI